MRKILITLSDGRKSEATFDDALSQEEVIASIEEQLPPGGELASLEDITSPSSAMEASSVSASRGADISSGTPTSGTPKLTLEDVRKEMKGADVSPYWKEMLPQVAPSTSRYMLNAADVGESGFSLGAVPSIISDAVTAIPRFAVSGETTEPGMSYEEASADSPYLALAYDPATFVPVGAPEKVGGTILKGALAGAKFGAKQGAVTGGIQAAEGRPGDAAASMVAGPLLGGVLGAGTQKLKNVAFDKFQSMYDLPSESQAGYLQSKVPGMGSTKAAVESDIPRALMKEDEYALRTQNWNPIEDIPGDSRYIPGDVIPRPSDADDLATKIAKSADASLQDDFARVKNKMSPSELKRSQERISEMYSHLRKLSNARYGQPISSGGVQGLLDTYSDVPAITQALKSWLTSFAGEYQAGQSYLVPKAKEAVSDVVGRVLQGGKYALTPENLTRASEVVRRDVQPASRLAAPTVKPMLPQDSTKYKF